MGLVMLLHPPMQKKTYAKVMGCSQLPSIFPPTLVRLLVIEMFAPTFFAAAADFQFEFQKGSALANHRLVSHQRSLHGQQSVIRRVIDPTD